MAAEQKRLVPTFYHHPDHGPVCETRTGPEAGADTVIEKLNDEHARLHPEEYARFVSSFGLTRPAGTDLKKIPGVDDTTVSVLAVHGVTTVEKLATMNDADAANLMPHTPKRVIEFRDIAKIIMSTRPTVKDDEQVIAQQQTDAAKNAAPVTAAKRAA